MRFACQLSTSSDIILVRFFVISYVIKREEEKKFVFYLLKHVKVNRCHSFDMLLDFYFYIFL